MTVKTLFEIIYNELGNDSICDRLFMTPADLDFVEFSKDKIQIVADGVPICNLEYGDHLYVSNTASLISPEEVYFKLKNLKEINIDHMTFLVIEKFAQFVDALFGSVHEDFNDRTLYVSSSEQNKNATVVYKFEFLDPFEEQIQTETMSEVETYVEDPQTAIAQLESKSKDFNSVVSMVEETLKDEGLNVTHQTYQNNHRLVTELDGKTLNVTFEIQ